MPFFSIITPAYNREKMIAITINSVLAQKFTDWELIIIDDGSKDKTREAVSTFEDVRIKYFYQNNAERSAARNNGISKATGEFICFLDSDDEYLPQHLQTFYDYIASKNFEAAFYYAPSIIKKHSGQTVSLMYDGPEHAAQWAWHALLQNCGVCMPREFLDTHQFPAEFNVWEDMHLWLRLLVQHKFYQLPEPLAVVHYHDDRSINNMFDNLDTRHIDKYAACINHLFENYGNLLAPILTLDMRNQFLFDKYMTFAEIAAQKGKLDKFKYLLHRALYYLPQKKYSGYVWKLIAICLRNAILK
ncbi:MAG: glycosyltransferase family 2 protein [Bacteroidetes bacterium]|nr:glycosyltransferase family 2 protein [Bacteroidota bacterium]